MSIECETAAIDRWIEPAHELEYTCRKCGHLPDVHDEYGCYAFEANDPNTNSHLGEPCDCGGFE